MTVAPSTKPFVPKTFSNEEEHRRKLADGIVWAIDRISDVQSGATINYGTEASTACEGNDFRLFNARPPLSHATSHKIGGTDPLRLDDLGGRLLITESISMNGDGATPATSHVFVAAALEGVSTSFIVASHTHYCVDKMESTSAGSSINALYVNLGTIAGAGRGNRTAGNFVVGHTVPTGQSPGDYNDNLSYHTGVFSTMYCTAGDGGVSGYPRGDFYGFGGVVTLKSTCGLYNHGIIGAEFDVAVEASAGVVEKIILQLVTVNSDAVKGSAIDAGIVMCGDASVTGFLTKGIAFGKTGYRWNIDGDIIGTYACSNSMTCVNGINLSGVTFSNCSLIVPGCYITAVGDVVAYGVYVNNVFGMFSQAAPSAPASGITLMYRDTADGKVKLKDSTHTTVLN